MGCVYLVSGSGLFGVCLVFVKGSVGFVEGCLGVFSACVGFCSRCVEGLCEVLV